MQTLKIPSRIHKIGLEIEGGWSNRRRVKYDGSVRVDGLVSGEIVSRPLVRPNTITKFIAENWPDNTNATCGFHVHISLRSNADYSTLMQETFLDFFCNHMVEFGKTWGIKNELYYQRLAGENSFCRKTWAARAQAKATSKINSRYSLWNFCYRLHRTAECRAFPTFKESKTALAVLQTTLDCVDAWCRTAPRIVTLDDEIEMPELSPLIEETDETI